MSEQQPQHQPVSANYEHCRDVYEAMVQSGTTEIIDETNVLVYEGYLTRLFTHLGLSVPHYTHVMKVLKQMDCVRQIRRGGGSSASRWLLIQAPSPDLYKSSSNRPSAAKKTSLSAIQQQLNDLARRVSTLETAREREQRLEDEYVG